MAVFNRISQNFELFLQNSFKKNNMSLKVEETHEDPTCSINIAMNNGYERKNEFFEKTRVFDVLLEEIYIEHLAFMVTLKVIFLQNVFYSLLDLGQKVYFHILFKE